MRTLINLFKYLTLLFTSFVFIQCSEDLVDVNNKGVLKGIVVKHRTNEPLANVKVSTAPTTKTVFTGSDGTFIIEDMPLGDYSAKAELQGYLMEIEGVNIIDNGQEVNIVFEMKDDQSLNSPPTIPELLTPADNTIDTDLEVQLSWRSTDADEDDLVYRLIVKNDRNDVILDINDLSNPNYLLENLNYGTSYFWQVIVSDGVNPDVFSQISKFTTNRVPQNRFHYVTMFGNNHVIYSTNENGNSFRFTQESVNSLRPRKNNAASLVAFLRITDGNAHIYTAKPDGNDAFRVTEIPLAGFNVNELDYAWSTNGNEFIYPNFNKLYRVNKDGSGTQLIYTTNDGSFITECAWSTDGSKIALKTNSIDGYQVKIYVIDMAGNLIKTVLENVNGAAGGLDFSTNGNKLLYAHDVSGYQSPNYRQLDTRIFIYDLSTDEVIDLSELSQKPNGFLDLDPRFSPNDAEVIFTQTSNDGISVREIYKLSIEEESIRTLLFSNAWMPDWE